MIHEIYIMAASYLAAVMTCDQCSFESSLAIYPYLEGSLALRFERAIASSSFPVFLRL